MYKISKILNNNVVCCLNDDQKQLIAFGKGIGFQKKIGQFLPLTNIVNLYELKNISHYEKLVKESDDQIVSITEEIIQKMKESFKQEFDHNLHVTLLDHLQFSVKRYRQNMLVKNVFLEETKYFYPTEYVFAKKALQMVNENLNIKLPEAEAGFLCMHIHASLHHEDLGFANLCMQIIKDVLHIIENELAIDLNDLVDIRQRLMTHIRFAIKRALDKKELENDLQHLIAEKYAQAFAIARKIAAYLADNYQICFSDAELAYLSIHLENIIRTIQKK